MLYIRCICSGQKCETGSEFHRNELSICRNELLIGNSGCSRPNDGQVLKYCKLGFKIEIFEKSWMQFKFIYKTEKK